MIGEQKEFPGELVSIESPFAGDIEMNTRYARACMRDALLRGEDPTASHLLYTQPGILDDAIPEERARGMEAGFRWNRHARATIVYTDLGTTPGMEKGILRAHADGREVIFRTLGPGWDLGRAVDAYGLNPRQRRDIVYRAMMDLARGDCPCGYQLDPTIGVCTKCRTNWSIPAPKIPHTQIP
jgi:hypothetical protein